jgi:ABC-type nitrate/sulfonate/bicarbonate transport system permease component
MSWALRVATPVLSVLALWYLAIVFSGLPAFVIPRPERVLEVLWVDRAFMAWRSCSTCCRRPATC